MKNKNNLRINLGGGANKIEGFLNLDIIDIKEVDIKCNLEEGIPLPDNSVIEVRAFHILEHINNLSFVLEELHRVCKNKAIINIKSPYFKSNGAFKDLTHKSFITEETFYYFNKNERAKRDLPYYGQKAEFEIKDISYIWSNRWLGLVPFKQFLLSHFWNIARTIRTTLIVCK